MLNPGAEQRPIEHGGEPGGLGDNWLDLSTGINPVPYPFSAPGPESWARLPRNSEHEALLEAAAAYYQAPGVSHITAAPGSQALIQLLPRLFERQTVQIVAPTYGEHAVCWRRAGHVVGQIPRSEGAVPDHILIVVNPNNPDGRCHDPQALERLAHKQTRAGNWLVVDEAFADVTPGNSAASLVRDNNVIVLKSFGKFFGLAGLRLGFALAPEPLSRAIAAEFGPWAVSGPALNIAARALADEDWCKATRARLRRDVQQLDQWLSGAGLEVLGGTDLFRLVQTPAADRLYGHLRDTSIHVRRFAEHPTWLRFGLPAPDDGHRLSAALAGFAAQ